MSNNTHPASRLIELYTHDLSYCDPAIKQAFHREAKKVLRRLAACMGLKKGSFDVRSNMAGIAVSGEVTLHTERVYVQLSQSSMGAQSAFLLRSCKGRKDYTGGMNHFAPITVLQDLDQFAIFLEGVAMNRVCGMSWNPQQARIMVMQIRANKVINPALERVRERFEEGELPIEVFEQAIAMAERTRVAA